MKYLMSKVYKPVFLSFTIGRKSQKWNVKIISIAKNMATNKIVVYKIVL